MSRHASCRPCSLGHLRTGLLSSRVMTVVNLCRRVCRGRPPSCSAAAARRRASATPKQMRVRAHLLSSSARRIPRAASMAAHRWATGLLHVKSPVHSVRHCFRTCESMDVWKCQQCAESNVHLSCLCRRLMSLAAAAQPTPAQAPPAAMRTLAPVASCLAYRTRKIAPVAAARRRWGHPLVASDATPSAVCAKGRRA